MNRLSAIALSAALLIGAGASSASAASSTYRPTDPGVKVCVSALKWAHAKPTADREDFAVIVCGETVTTPKQGKSLYKWAKQHKWAYNLIG